MKKTVSLVYLMACGLAFAQVPTVDKTSVAFTYQYNNANNVLNAKVTAKSTVAMNVSFNSALPGWLSVTPSAGSSPLALTLTANPSSLSPGTYTGTVSIFTGSTCTPGTNCIAVYVTLTITNPASSLLLSAPSSATYPLTATSTATAFTLALPYTSGVTPLPWAEIDVSTTGDIIPFTATTAVTKAGTGTTANWLRVANGVPASGICQAATSTSGVASGSSMVRICVTLDQSTLDTLDATNYTGTVTIAPVKTGSGSSGSTTTYTVTVTLSVTPGSPILCTTPLPGATLPSCVGVQVPVFPSQVPAIQTSSTVAPVPPILTIYGDNFFNNGSWVFYQRTSTQGTASQDLAYHALPTTWVSRRILTAIIPVADLTPPGQVSPPETWSIVVVNGAPNTKPSNGGAQTVPPAMILVTDPSQPYIQSVVNAASYLPAATQLPVPAPAGTVPLYPGGTSVVSPREIVSIFGQGLGLPSVCSNTPVPILNNGVPVGNAMQYTSTLTCSNSSTSINIGVTFQVQNTKWPAPLIMATYNQINAIVPFEIEFLDDGSTPVPDGAAVNIQVTVGSQPPYSYSAVKMAFDPGIFTFGGNGQGQAAVLNVDATTGAVTVNGAASAPKGSPIEIFMTGLGDVNATGIIDGQVATGPIPLSDDSYRVLIGGQSAVIFYGGTAGTGVAGLVQINAIVPPNTASGAQPVTVEIGAPSAGGAITARRSQTGVTINVK